MSSRPSWATLLLPGQPDLNGKTLSQNNNRVTWKQATYHLLQNEENNPQCLIKYSTWSRGLKTQVYMAAVLAHTWLHTTPLWSNSRFPGLVTFCRELPTKTFKSLGPVTKKGISFSSDCWCFKQHINPPGLLISSKSSVVELFKTQIPFRSTTDSAAS